MVETKHAGGRKCTGTVVTPPEQAARHHHRARQAQAPAAIPERHVRGDGRGEDCGEG
jgi:hypothetical protein